MADETHLAPPPPPPPETGLTDTPRKPWAKPTVQVIGETILHTLSGATPENNEIRYYNPQS